MQTVATASKLGLVLLDACRNNPFANKMQRVATYRAMTRGLERVKPAGSVLVAFAARDGTTASDGQDRNSPFTQALLKHLETPDLEINLLFRRISRRCHSHHAEAAGTVDLWLVVGGADISQANRLVI